MLPQIYKLGSFKVDQIKKEETRLAEDNKAVVEQTQDLAITNYKTFIQTSECSRRIFTEFKETEAQLDQLVGKLPNLTGKCEQFIKTSSEINASRRLNSLTLRRNADLLEILELPQLMDTCIYQGKYEEALELAAHVQRLGVKHGDIPIINVSLVHGSLVYEFDCNEIVLFSISLLLSEHCESDWRLLAHYADTVIISTANRFAIAEVFTGGRLLETNAGILDVWIEIKVSTSSR